MLNGHRNDAIGVRCGTRTPAIEVFACGGGVRLYHVVDAEGHLGGNHPLMPQITARLGTKILALPALSRQAQ